MSLIIVVFPHESEHEQAAGLCAIVLVSAPSLITRTMTECLRSQGPSLLSPGHRRHPIVCYHVQMKLLC